MFSVPTNNDSLFNFFQSQNSIFPFQKSQPQNLLSGSSQNNHSSAKKLNFEEKDEIFVSQFSFSPEKPEKSQPEHDATKKSHELMEIEEESNSPKYKLALKSDESLQSLNKTNKNNFSLLQITVPPKYPKKKEESSAESWQKRNQNIIG